MTKKTDGDTSEKRPSVNANTRLFDVLSKIKNTRGSGIFGAVLPTILDIHDTDGSYSSMRASAVMYKMMESAVREIEYYLPDEVEFYMPEIRSIRVAVSPLIYANSVDTVNERLTQAQVTHLRHTGQRLKKLAPELQLWPHELDQLLESIDSLRDMVDQLNINESDKHKLRQRCGSMRASVEEYRFWGVEGIEVRFDAAHSALVPFVEKEPSGKLTTTWKTIGAAMLCISTVLGNANSVIKTARESFALLESAAKTVSHESTDIIQAIEDTLGN